MCDPGLTLNMWVDKLPPEFNTVVVGVSAFPACTLLLDKNGHGGGVFALQLCPVAIFF